MFKIRYDKIFYFLIFSPLSCIGAYKKSVHVPTYPLIGPFAVVPAVTDEKEETLTCTFVFVTTTTPIQHGTRDEAWTNLK